jgi:Flp pilus assembly protein TadD
LHKSLWSILALSLAAMVAVAALAAVAPNLNLPKALEAQRRLAAERPDDPSVFNDLGNLLLLANHPDEAETAYRRALELDPRRVSAHFNLGLLLQQRNERREALRHYREVVEIDPRHAWGYFQMGMVHEAMGEESKAVDAYARAYSLNPQLAFPEVNPNVLDSKLVTASMIKAYREGTPLPLAPTRYDDPQRIAGLLVPPVETPAADEEEVAETPAQEPGAEGSGSADSTAADTAPQVLRPNDLTGGGAAGQATRPGVSRTVPGQAGRQPAETGRPALRNWTRPEPMEEPVEEEAGNEEFVPPPPPTGVIYRPGLPSSGRLDLKVIPGRRPATEREG